MKHAEFSISYVLDISGLGLMISVGLSNRCLSPVDSISASIPGLGWLPVLSVGVIIKLVHGAVIRSGSKPPMPGPKSGRRKREGSKGQCHV